MKYILITGTNSGIGEKTCEFLLKKGYHVFGSVRDKKNAETLKAKLGENFTPLVFDITDEIAISKAVSLVKTQLGQEGLSALINNAGIVISGALKELATADFKKQLDVNLVGIFMVTKAFLPLLGADKSSSIKPGRIINISSLSGIRTFPFLGAYSISKHGMEALTDGLRRELLLYGIDVIGILPGSVNTPLIGKMESGITQASKFSDYATMLVKFKELNEAKVKQGVPIEKVVNTILQAIENPKPKARYYLRTSFLTDFLLPTLLPTRLFDKIIASKLGIKNEKK